jgi:hypothetical protein
MVNMFIVSYATKYLPKRRLKEIYQVRSSLPRSENQRSVEKVFIDKLLHD